MAKYLAMHVINEAKVCMTELAKKMLEGGWGELHVWLQGWVLRSLVLLRLYGSRVRVWTDDKR